MRRLKSVNMVDVFSTHADVILRKGVGKRENNGGMDQTGI
jgi:hypothetical protein